MAKDIVDLLYEAWSPHYHMIEQTTEKEYHDMIRIQLEEIHEFLGEGDVEHAIAEMADIISIAVNWIRSQGLDARATRKAIRKRILTRYQGKTLSIIRKYRKLSGVE